MFHSLENWFTLLNGFIVMIIGIRVFWLDPSNRVYLFFLASTSLLFIQQLFFFEMAYVQDVEAVTHLRRWQETIWNFAAMTIFVTMWYYGRKFTPYPPYRWERILFVLILLCCIPFIYLQAFTPYGHGEMVVMENGKWGMQIDPFSSIDVLRALWALISYLCGIFWCYLPYHYAKDRKAKRLRLLAFAVFTFILLGSYTQNYLLPWWFGMPSALNESASVIVAVLFSGLMFSNFQMFEFRTEHTLPNILRTMTNWFILTDPDFNIKQINEELAGAFELEMEEVHHLTITDLLPPEQWRSFEEGVRTLSTNEAQNCEFRFELDGRTMYILFTITPVIGRGENKWGYVFVGTNLTSFRESEIRIREYTRELETSNQALERFAYIASHDLKEPIRNIGNFAGLLKRRLGQSISPENAEFLSFIISNVKGMNQLIEAVMSVSLIGQNGLDNQFLDPATLLETATANLESLIQEKGARIEYPKLPKVYGDEQLLIQLFQNLLENGLKYNESGQALVRISAHPSDRPGFFEFTFIDNGIGIDPEYRDQVFEMFKRLHTRSEYAGTGIGLAICRRIVELHHGQIWIDTPSHGQGTAFHFLLPQHAEAYSPFSPSDSRTVGQ